MEGSHFASSSPAQQEDSWTCQRCGWVYPNAHPSAKHRRNHKKHCGKIKGFELHSEVQKGGSSDEASSDDNSHVNKESSLLQSSQAQHDSIRPVEPVNVVHVAEPPGASQSRELLLLPETNVSDIITAETPVHTISDSGGIKPEDTPHESMQNVDLTESEPSAAEHIPNIGPSNKTAKTLGDGMDVRMKDLTGDSTKIAASGILEGHSYEGFVSAGLEKVDAAVRDSPALVSNQIDGAVEGASMHENSGPKHAVSMAFLDEPSRKVEEEGRVSLPSCAREAEKDIEESRVLDSYQSKEKQKREITITPVDHSINRQGSSQDEDSWTCHRCGWVYPNPHPSAKHRRNHKKHCGKLKGCEVQAELHKGGSSDEVSSDEEKKEHIQHESSPMIQAQNPAGGLTTTGVATSSGDQSSDLSTSRENSFAERLPEGPDVQGVIRSTKSSDIDPRYAVSPSEENLERQGQGKGAAAGNYAIKAPHDSDGLETLQSKEEIPSSQAISTERELNAVPSSAVSEGLGYLVTDTPNVVGSTSKVSDAPHGLTGDSTPNVENSSVLNVLPSADTFPPVDVASSNAEEDKIGAVVTLGSHPGASGLANENLEPFGGTESNQDGHLNETSDESEKLDLVKPSGLGREMLDRNFSSNFPPVLVAGNAPDEEAESFSVEDRSVLQTGLPLEALSTANIASLGNDLEGEKKFVNVQATAAPVGCLAKDEVPGHEVGGPEDASFFSIEKFETPHETEMPVQSSQNRTSMGEVVSEKRTTPTDIHGETVSVSDAPTSMIFSSESKIIPESVPLVSGEETLATSVKDEVSGQTDGGLEETSTSSFKVVERPQVTGMPAQSLGNPGADITEERTKASTTGELLLSDEKPTSTTIELNSEAIPESGSSGLVGDTLATSTIMNMANNSGLSSLPKSLESGTIVGETVSEKRTTPADVSVETVTIHGTPTSMAFSSETKIIPEKVPESKIISESNPLVSLQDTLTTDAEDEVLNQTNGALEETSTSSISKVVVRSQVTEMPAQSLGITGADVSEERTVADTTAEFLLSDDWLTSPTIESKVEAIPERVLPAQVGDTLATSTIVNVTDDSGLSSSTKESDSKQSSLVKEVHEDKTAVSSRPLEALEKSDIKDNTFYETDFGSSGRSLDGTNSFTKAESEFSQRSEFAASSHKVSDSLEIFEDAPDTLDACSVGGSIEESESLDEPRQDADGIPDSKLLKNASLDERTAGEQKPYVMNGATDELEQEPNAMNAGKASTEKEATTIPAGTSYSVPAKVEELKAPSPEAWQEPGHSASVKQGKKIITSEVMEDEKSGESHTALRSLMAKEGKDKMDQQAVTSSVIVADPQSSEEKEASANGKKPKSRLRSFWSHCICCPAVH